MKHGSRLGLFVVMLVFAVSVLAAGTAMAADDKVYK